MLNLNVAVETQEETISTLQEDFATQGQELTELTKEVKKHKEK